MEEKKTIFDYLGQVFMIFGITVAILNVFCLLFGDSAKEMSSMFVLGSQGIGIRTMAEYLIISAIVVGMRCLFFTDMLIKKLSVAARTALMVLSVLGVTIIFILIFDWFPVNMWQTWTMFFVCFGICFCLSTLMVSLKEKAENRKMQEALRRLKQEETDFNQL